MWVQIALACRRRPQQPSYVIFYLHLTMLISTILTYIHEVTSDDSATETIDASCSEGVIPPEAQRMRKAKLEDQHAVPMQVWGKPLVFPPPAAILPERCAVGGLWCTKKRGPPLSLDGHDSDSNAGAFRVPKKLDRLRLICDKRVGNTQQGLPGESAVTTAPSRFKAGYSAIACSQAVWPIP